MIRTTRIFDLSRATARAVGGAAAATAVGLSLGAMARAAHASDLGRARQSAPVRLAATALDWSKMDAPHAWARLTASLHGTGPMFAELALGATALIATVAAVRAVMLWRASRTASAAAGGPSRDHVASTPAELTHHSDAPRRRFAAAFAALRSRLVWRRTPRQAERVVVAAPAVRALAVTGASRADIARRTGLSRDAVALALYLE